MLMTDIVITPCVSEFEHFHLNLKGWNQMTLYPKSNEERNSFLLYFVCVSYNNPINSECSRG